MKTGLYIHIPFCEKKCNYCDFYSITTDKSIQYEYINALVAEENRITDRAMGEVDVNTVYIGGGTPTCLDDGELLKMYNAFSFDKSGIQEFTVEGNPNSYSDGKISEYLEIGVTRTSVGVQCLNEKTLSALGRLHSAEQAVGCLDRLVKAGFDVSADYMVGLPYQSTESVISDISRIINTGVGHVSCYGLILEENTALYNRVRSNEITLPVEDKAVEMYDAAKNILESNGLKRYETSNFGKPCMHNSGYWQMNGYIGLGASAHGFLNKRVFEKIYNEKICGESVKAVRYYNKSDVDGYIKSLRNHRFFPSGVRVLEESLTESDMIEETIMLGLRLDDGIDLSDFAVKYGETALNNLLKKAETQVKYLNISRQSVSLKSEFAYVANSVITELI